MTWPIVEFEAFGGVDVIVRECPETGRQRREVRANEWGEHLPVHREGDDPWFVAWATDSVLVQHIDWSQLAALEAAGLEVTR